MVANDQLQTEKGAVRTPSLTEREGFVSARQATEFVSYSPDYISRLAREGKVLAEQRGRQWFVSLNDLKRFSLEQQAEQRARQEALRVERLAEYTKKQAAQQQAVAAEAATTGGYRAVLVSGIATTCLLLVATLGWVSYQERLSLADFASGTANVFSALETAGLTFSWLIPAGITEPAVIPSHQVFITEEGVEVVAGTPVSDVFSDPVVVREVATSSVILEPVFTPEPSDAYRIDVRPRNPDTL
jgi:hypothetical protein